VLFIVAVFVVQGLALPFVTVLPSIPLILPLAAVDTAMFEGGFRGAATGLLTGALCDVAMNRPIALFAVLLTLVCLIVGVLSETVVARGFAPYFLVCAGTLLVCALAQMFTLLFFDGVPSGELFAEAVSQTAVSLPFTAPVYFALSKTPGRER
jgi:cell shape-determining protein MreD